VKLSCALYLARLALPWVVVAGPAVVAAAPSIELDKVEVRGASIGARDQRSLGDLFRAQKIFEELRPMAPQASFRVRVLPRKNRKHAELMRIQVLAESRPFEVGLDPLGRFEVDPQWAMLPQQTIVRSRLRDGAVAWRADVRTPGLPANARRLGDLRLECKINWTVPLGRTGVLPYFQNIFGAGRMCTSPENGAINSLFADAPVLAVDLVHGERRERLSYFFLHGAGDNLPTRAIFYVDWDDSLRDRMVRLPLHDQSWPDDALVEFIFMDSAALAQRGDTQ
jgi:hypothetical protein